MRVISNDTNIWLGFDAISRIDLLFRLPYVYTIYKEAFEQSDNLSEIKYDLLSNGLVLDDVSTEEFFYAIELRNRYAKLTRYDCITLAIAKLQNIPILTDDKFGLFKVLCG